MLLYQYSRDKHGHLKKELSLLSAEPYFYIQMPDGENAPVFDFKAFPFDIFKNAPAHKKNGKTRDKVNYIDLAISFDIETTTLAYLDRPAAFMYQWQYCIEDYVFMGKTWEQFQQFNIILSSVFDLSIYEDGGILYGNSLVVYVHNLQFEFQFMRHFLGELINPLFTDIYEPLYVPTKDGLTFRCSYRLTNKSLEQFTKGQPHAKLAGDLDYSIIRVPVMNDPKNGLNDTELAYCYNDVKGLSEAIRDRLEKDKYNIASIPLTSTGYVRKDARRSAKKNPQWYQQFQAAKLDPHLYELCRMAFRGGNTHANAAIVGRVIENVHHLDITSSYPAQMLTKGFPMTPFEKVEHIENIIPHLRAISKKYCLLLKFRLINFKYIGKTGVPYIAKAKTITRIQDFDKIVEDNGRLYSAPYALLACTEIDLQIILRDYTFDRIEIIEAYKSEKKLLPWELRRVVLEYYTKKTQLKGLKDPDSLYNYARAKEQLNSCYGMLCQRPDHLDYEYINGEYIESRRPLADLLNEYYESESSFLWYQWALWVTAHARFALDQGMQIVGSDLCYIDTDSIFYVGDHQEELEKLNTQLETIANNQGATATNQAGKSFPCGVWTWEPEIKFFKTLGAKKYLCGDGKTIESTISGVSKEAGQKFFTENGFDAFKDGCVIPVSGKLTAYYNNDDIHTITINGVDITTASNIAMINTSYTINIDREFDEFVQMLANNLKQRYNNPVEVIREI